MTQFLIDIAFYQSGLDLSQVEREGFAAVIARASTGYRPSAASHPGGSADPEFAAFKAAARRTNLLFAAYHYLYPSRVRSIEQQATVCAAAIGDTSVPVMIDHENGDGTGIPSKADAYAFRDAMRRRGYRVPLWYLPRGWIWSAMGSPNVADCGMQLVASNYIGKGSYASALYPGQAGAGWQSYGGMKPAIWQFTDGAKVAGKQVDANAFEGTRAELAALLTGTTDQEDPEVYYTSVGAGRLTLRAGQVVNVQFTEGAANTGKFWGFNAKTKGGGYSVGAGGRLFSGDVTVELDKALPAGVQIATRFVETDPKKNYAVSKAHPWGPLIPAGDGLQAHVATTSWVDPGKHLWVQLRASKDMTVSGVWAKVGLFNG